MNKALALKKYSINYICGILRNWQREGYPSGERNILERKSSQVAGKLLKFTDCPQREYDYDKLERMLLGWETIN